MCKESAENCDLQSLSMTLVFKTALTPSGHAGGSGVEVRGAAYHDLEGVVDALGNQDDLEEGVEGVRAYSEGQE